LPDGFDGGFGVGWAVGLGVGLVSPDEPGEEDDGSSSIFCFKSRTLSAEAGLVESAGFSPEVFEESFEASDARCLPDEFGPEAGWRSGFVADGAWYPGRKLLNNSFHLMARPITIPAPTKTNNNSKSSKRLPARPTWLLPTLPGEFSGV
jgi:hypothetical protein